MRFQSIAEAVGRTPLIELKNIGREYGLAAKLYAKAEFMNPAGSVKDRVAAEILSDAERRGLLKEGTLLIEPTSGNTGIGAGGDRRGEGVSARHRDARDDERRTPSDDSGFRGGARPHGREKGHGGRDCGGGAAA